MSATTGSTVEFNSSSVAQTIPAFTYGNLVLSGTTAKTLAGTTSVHDLTVSSGITLTANQSLTVNGNTNIDGGISFTNNTGTKIFIGLVTIGSAGTWTNATEGFTFRGGITNNNVSPSAFTGGTSGAYLFDTNAQALAGTGNLAISTVTVTGVQLTNNVPLSVTTSITLTNGPPSGSLVNNSSISIGTTLTVNNGTLTNNTSSSITTGTTVAANSGTINNNGILTIGTNLSGTGTGTLTQGAGATLNIGGTSSITTLDAFTNANTVNYNGAGQPVQGVRYNNLTLSGSGTKTLAAGTANIDGNFTLSGTAATTAVVALTIGGDVNLASGTIFTAGAFTHNVAGNWSDSGSGFTNTGGTISLNGSVQSISVSAPAAFNNLTLFSAGTKTFAVSTTISGALVINTGAMANILSNSTAGTLTLGGLAQIPDTYGSSTSGANHQDNTYFAGNGILIVAGNIFYSITSGLWNASSTWSTTGHNGTAGSSFPQAGDLAVIGSGLSGAHTVTVNATTGQQYCSTLSFDGAGTASISGATLTVSGDITGIGASNIIKFTGAGTLQVGRAMFTSANGTLTAGSGTVEYNGSGAQNVQALPYYNLTLSGSGNKAMAAAFNISNDLLINNGATFTIGAFTTTITGFTTVNGTLSITNATGTKTFIKLVKLNSGGNWNNPANEGFTFRGGFWNNGGTFTGGVTGTWLFNTNNQALTGAFTIPTITVTGIQLTNNNALTVTTSVTLTNGPPTSSLVNAGSIDIGTSLTVNNGTVTNNASGSITTGTTVDANNGIVNNNGTVTVGTDLTGTGTGTLTQGTNATLNIGGASTIANMTATANGNTVNFSGVGQTLNPVSFYHLTLSGSGTKTFGVSTAVAGNLSIGTGVVADLGSITSHTANALILGGGPVPSGSWGSNGSTAAHKNNTYFLNSSSGIITVTTGASIYYVRTNGDWNDPATWSTVAFGGVSAVTTPVSGDQVMVGGGFAVTVSDSEACSILQFDQSAPTTNSLTINGSLTVNSSITIPRNGGSNTLAVGSGLLTAPGIDFTSGAGAGVQQLTIGTGTATVSGDVTGIGASSAIQFSDVGTLKVGRYFIYIG